MPRSDGRPLWRLRAAVRPARRGLAWLALVDEERVLRDDADRLAEQSARADLQELSDQHTSMEARMTAVEARAVELEDRMIRRLDALVSEVVHRFEVREAHLATAFQRLADQVEDQERERSAIVRLLAGPVRLGAPPEPAALEAGPSWYRLFEEFERGSREDVIQGFRRYLPHLRVDGEVVDLGCGRGEFLELADWIGLPAYGVDLAPEAVAACEKLGLRALNVDLFEHLRTLAPRSLGGVFSAQVVEHLPPDRLHELFELIARVLRPGGVAILETPNPASFAVHVHSFWRDPTHTRPVPPPALWFAARRAGLIVTDTIFSAPPPDDDRLSGYDGPADGDEMHGIAKQFNQALERLNDVLFGPQNYAVVVHAAP
jgi:SAM-dependent methyltransferase